MSIFSWCLDIIVGFSHEFLCIHTARRLFHATCDLISLFFFFLYIYIRLLLYNIYLYNTRYLNKSELWPVQLNSRVVGRIVASSRRMLARYVTYICRTIIKKQYPFTVLIEPIIDGRSRAAFTICSLFPCEKTTALSMMWVVYRTTI